MSNKNEFVYETPDFDYWDADQLDSIEAQMSGGGIYSSKKAKAISLLRVEYGFTLEEARCFDPLYQYVSSNFDNYMLKLFQIIAQTNYSGWEWDAIAGISVQKTNEILKHITSPKFDSGLFTNAIKNQHKGCEDAGSYYYGKSDLSHLAATISTILYTGLSKFLGNVAYIYNGVITFGEVVNINAGYIGDVCGTHNLPPCMTVSDYKADLDAVNIAAQLLDNPDSDPIDLIIAYFDRVRTYGRAKEFVDNVGWNTLQEQQTEFESYVSHAIFGSSNPNESPLLEEYNDYIKVFKQFMKNLEKNNREWVEYEI